jgi:two-component system chemotaxis sensor kinase CheA
VDDLTKEFLAESREGLDRMDRCLTQLETQPGDRELLSEIFRSVHTIKGTTGFLGFGRLEMLAHSGENLLGALRDGELEANPDVIDGLLQLMDGLRRILELIERLGHEGDRSDDQDLELIELMRNLKQHGHAGERAIDPGLVSAPAAVNQSAADKTLRIDVEVLDRMVNLVGELVLTRNQILQCRAGSSTLPELARRLDCVTADLRETVMQARMQPVGVLFGKFPRMVRDLARSCGKQVRIELRGESTGLDKTLIEAIKDPLIHALRNAIDHGIERPEQRLAAGKPAEGLVMMRAWHQSGFVLVEISDDGAGISARRVLAKALERGLLTEEQAAHLTLLETQELIFMPGFSTAAEVSHISGRGVGMDVVRANVEKAGGTVELESLEGCGTTLRLRVPLTLAIVPALVVSSGGHTFCLPQSALLELVYVTTAEAGSCIERIGDTELYRLRERLLPMIWLDTLLGLEHGRTGRCKNGFYLAVLEADGCHFGLVVDELMNPEEIVVKPIPTVLRDIGMFSGATVLGNGTLALILYVAATAARAGVKPGQVSARDEERTSAPVGESPSFLVFAGRTESRWGAVSSTADEERRALPLSLVERIESIPRSAMEYVGGRYILQYRGELLPVEDAGSVLENTGAEEILTVLICRRRDAGRSGLIVRAVLDVGTGSPLASGLELCGEPLALIGDRLTVVHALDASAPRAEERWREVA